MIKMPAIITSTIKFGLVGLSVEGYYIDLEELATIFPHIRAGKSLRLYLVELRNEEGKLVKRFKPFQELELRMIERLRTMSLCIVLPEDVASQLGVGNNYRVTIVITAYDGKPFLPLEVKFVGNESEKVFECFSRLETSLISLNLEKPPLNKAISYLVDAYVRLEENDVEGARTSVRNSLHVIRDEVIPKIEVIEEAKDFPKNLKDFVNCLAEFVHYGGPHPGPAPRSITEMLILMSIELVKYLAKMLEDKVISLHGEVKATL